MTDMQKVSIPPRPVDDLFPDLAALKRAGVCPKCRQAVDVTEFLSDVDYAEYRITGYCLGCMTVVYQQLAEMEEK